MKITLTAILIVFVLIVSAVGQDLTNSRTMVVLYGVRCSQTDNHTENGLCAKKAIVELRKAADTAFLKYHGGNCQKCLPLIVDDSSTIIMKLDENIAYGSDTLTVSVFASEDNSLLWEKSRTVLDIDNDVQRLIAAFVEDRSVALKAEYDRVVEQARADAEQKRDYCTDNPEKDKGYCASPYVYLEDYQAAQKKKAKSH